ncbi:MAG: heavy-metal-associated domain-containing protein [Pseudanabaenales cyanobacterium]|nr:heavy-metal-associated domain-containing protein [Pseudanabaenales cyanobacterium]
MTSLQLTVPSMACSACAETITKAVQTIDPEAKVEANPKTKRVAIETQAPQESVAQAITAAGYLIS